MNYYIPVTMPGGIPCGPPVEIPSQMLLARQEVDSLREQLRAALDEAKRDGESLDWLQKFLEEGGMIGEPDAADDD